MVALADFFEGLKLVRESSGRGNAWRRCKTIVCDGERGTRISRPAAKNCTDARIFMDNAPMLLSHDIKIYARRVTVHLVLEREHGFRA